MKEEPIARELSFQSTPVLIKTGIKLDIPIMADITGKTPDSTIRAVPDVQIEQKIEMVRSSILHSGESNVISTFQ